MGSAAVPGHAHAEIWRAESDNREATLVGTSSANLFSDAIGKGAAFYYWARFVNGKDDKGPFQGMQGVKAETSRDVYGTFSTNCRGR